MDTDSLKVSADACEESGNNHAAKLLRELSDGKATAYLVIEKQSEYNDEIFEVIDGAPQKLFLDRKEAVAYAKLQNARQYKLVNPMLFGYELSEITDLSELELATRVRKILGDENFGIPNGEDMWDNYEPIFPKKATDEQMLKIASLFKIEFFEVIKTKVAL